jgi:NAD+ synthase (glutamine-hydrolysing)
MKIALAQLNYIIGSFDFNSNKMIHTINQAREQGADLVIFSEMAICGYPPHDLLEQKSFVEKCLHYLNKVAKHCTDIAAVVGCPSINPNSTGKILYNSAFFLYKEKVQSVHHKALLPTYDIFDEYRYFEPGVDFQTVKFKDKIIAITICEDLWDDQPTENTFGRTRLYNVSPMEQLARQNPDFVINIAGSPFSYTKGKIKQDIFTNHAKKHHLPLFYVNQTGAHTDLIFDGGSLVVNPKGEVYDSLKLFDEDFKIYELKDIISEPCKTNLSLDKPVVEKIHDALVCGIKDYFEKSGLKKATLGLSGGIDSAVTLVLAQRALGAENLRVLLLPSKYSSDHSINDAIKLAENISVKYEIIGIQPIFDSFLNELKPIFSDVPSDLTEENIQARVRGTLLMALSNKFGNILLNTSNKSEVAVGYGTLYGDMNGGISVLGDVYKTDVYKLAHFINSKKEIIPNNIIVKPPSAELRPDQKDSDSLPEYDLLDSVLYQYIELQKTKDEIVSLGFDKQLVERVAKLVNYNEYKRFQTPPILRISSKAFGYGRKMPIVARY